MTKAKTAEGHDRRLNFWFLYGATRSEATSRSSNRSPVALELTQSAYSFPSGHTMHTVAFSFVAMAHHSGMIWVLIPFSSLIAMSRIILGLH
jgi:membrane-associated phospholipid phosphatase